MRQRYQDEPERQVMKMLGGTAELCQGHWTANESFTYWRARSDLRFIKCGAATSSWVFKIYFCIYLFIYCPLDISDILVSPIDPISE